MLEVKNGFLLCRGGGADGATNAADKGSDKSGAGGRIPLLSTTERLLSLLGYEAELGAADGFRPGPHGVLPPLAAAAAVVAVPPEEQEASQGKGGEDVGGGQGHVEAGADNADKKEGGEEEDEKVEAPKKREDGAPPAAGSSPYAELRRVHNSPDAVFRALDDVRDLKHRRDAARAAEAGASHDERSARKEDPDEEGAKKDKEKDDGAPKVACEEEGDAPKDHGGGAKEAPKEGPKEEDNEVAAKSKSEPVRGGRGGAAAHRPGHDPRARRNQALESQRERLRQVRSGQPVSLQGEPPDEGWVTLARVLNSLRVLTPVLLRAFLDDRRTDPGLEVGAGRTKLGGGGGGSRRGAPVAFFLGEAAFDVVPLRTLRRQQALLRDLLGFFGAELPAAGGGPSGGAAAAEGAEGASAEPPTPPAWSARLDELMARVAADSAGGTPSWAGVHPLDGIPPGEWEAAAAAAATLDERFGLLAPSPPSSSSSPSSPDDAEDRGQYLRAIEGLRGRIEGVLRERYPDARLSVYGSCLSGLSLGRDADVDLSLRVGAAADAKAGFEAGTLPVGRYQRSVADLVYACRAKLRAAPGGEFDELEAVARARVPVVKGRYRGGGEGHRNPHSDDGSIRFDVCLLNDIAVVNSGLVREYSLVDPRARAVMLAVKRWAKDNRVGSAQDNTLSSYTWMNLVVFYLQSVGLVPNLQSVDLVAKAGADKPGAGGGGDDADSDADYWSSVNSLQTTYVKWEQAREHWEPSELAKGLPVSALLYGFFRFYDAAFPSPLYLVSIKRGAGATLPKTVFAKRTLSLAVEDPFETFDSHCPHNLGIHGNEGGFRRIAGLLRSSAAHLRSALLSGGGLDVPGLWPEPAPLGEGAAAGAVPRDGAAGRPNRGGRGGGGAGGRQQQRGGGGGRGAGGRKPRATEKGEAAEGGAGAPDPAASGDEAATRRAAGGGRGPRGGGRAGRGGGGRRDAAKKDGDQPVGVDGEAPAATDGAATDDEGNKRREGGGGGNRRRAGGGRGAGGRSSRRAVDPPADGAVTSDDEGGKDSGKNEAGDRKPNRRHAGGRKPANGGEDATIGDEEAKSGGDRRGRQRGGRGQGRGRARSGTDASNGEAAGGDANGVDAPGGGQKTENGDGRSRGRTGGGRGRGARGGRGGRETSHGSGQGEAPAAEKSASVSSE